jgi:hypothetical protein
MHDLLILCLGPPALVWLLRHAHLPLHWLCHRKNWPIGLFITWRRPYDNVMMRGRICQICGKLNGVEPVGISYKRMMRGERFY